SSASENIFSILGRLVKSPETGSADAHHHHFAPRYYCQRSIVGADRHGIYWPVGLVDPFDLSRRKTHGSDSASLTAGQLLIPCVHREVNSLAVGRQLPLPTRGAWLVPAHGVLQQE